jgi:hypothetical protein
MGLPRTNNALDRNHQVEDGQIEIVQTSNEACPTSKPQVFTEDTREGVGSSIGRWRWGDPDPPSGGIGRCPYAVPVWASSHHAGKMCRFRGMVTIMNTRNARSVGSCWSHRSVVLVWLVVVPAPLLAQVDEFEKEPIRYSESKPDNIVSRLGDRIAGEQIKLRHDGVNGYLVDFLKELNVPVSSQTLVFSKTSLQRHRISPATPRALYFNDEVYVGICQAGDVLEVSVADPNLGTVFYAVDQDPDSGGVPQRQTDNCLICHGSSMTQGVPGHMIRSVFVDSQGFPILASGTYRIDHTSALEKRWGGWYVTGTHGDQTHLGNLVIPGKRVPQPVDNSDGQNVTELASRVRLDDYLSPHSDLIALMVLEHQAEGHNLLVRASFQTRSALHYQDSLNRELGEKADHEWPSTGSRIDAAGEPLVRYLLMSGEVQLTAQLAGTSGFAEEFSQRGPRDGQGRSLRELDLRTRLFKYPCSYLVYSPSFDALPERMLEYVARRFEEVLSGKDQSKEFAHLSAEDRRNIREILVETKPELAGRWTGQPVAP